MERIPQRRRVTLQLHLIYGYTVPEVAEITDSSPNTVKDRLRTAYNELRMIMDENPTLRTAMLEAIS
jgi:DNA-directed RNA polymerase specialized sigma24 family protein